MKTFIANDRDSIFFNMLWCTKVTFNDDLVAISRTTLNNLQLTKRENGKSIILTTFRTDEERTDVMEQEFGLKLSQEEQEDIKNGKMAVEKLKMQAGTKTPVNPRL